mmetsp:Transcript_86328/g.135000  ORF Transcript_86328/g.135000 Transcript_86328/m.135000 type:complete len:242 (-) Transcript_86328:369-1094(-)
MKSDRKNRWDYEEAHDHSHHLLVILCDLGVCLRISTGKPHENGSQKQEAHVRPKVHTIYVHMTPRLESNEQANVTRYSEKHEIDLSHSSLANDEHQVENNAFQDDDDCPPMHIWPEFNKQKLPPHLDKRIFKVVGAHAKSSKKESAETDNPKEDGENCHNKHAIPFVTAADDTPIDSQCLFSIWVGAAFEEFKRGATYSSEEREHDGKVTIESSILFHCKIWLSKFCDDLRRRPHKNIHDA